VDIDWLMGTFGAEELARFHRRYFMTDCERRFRILDTDCTGLLGLEKVQHGLVDMYPTLKLELRADGHHIPALGESLPSLIATFDADLDGYLDFDDFVSFVKFQQAWQAQFFFKEPHVSQPKLEHGARESKAAAPRALHKSASLPGLPRPHKPATPNGKKPRARKSSTVGTLGDALGDTLGDAVPLAGKWPKSRSAGKGSTYGAFDESSRPCSTVSTRCSSRGTLDSSRGSFYSSFAGISSTPGSR